MGYRLVELRIHLVVCIEKIELHTTNVCYPNGGMNHIVGVRNVNDKWIAVFVKYALNRNLIEVLCFILCNLLAIHAQSLCEVAEAIEETNSTHVNIAV